DYLLRRDQVLARAALSRYDPVQKAAVLQHVAMALQQARTGEADRRSLPYAELLQVTTALLRNLNLEPSHADPLIREVLTRTGILVPYESVGHSYGFRHLTMQEYLAAVELTGAPQRLLEYYWADRGTWRETLKLWCGMASYDCAPVIREVFA